MKSVTDMKGGVGAKSSTLRQCQGIGLKKVASGIQLHIATGLRSIFSCFH